MAAIGKPSANQIKAPRRALIIAAATLAALLAILLSLAPSRPLRAEEPGTVLLQITGAPNAHFSGTCRIGRGPNTRTLRLDGHPPFARRFAASAIRCDLVNTGNAPMVVVMRKPPGNVTQTSLCCRGLKASISLQ
jgi:hypothetical protein